MKKIILKQFFCRHIGMDISEDSNFKVCRDNRNEAYMMRTCEKCDKVFKDYHIVVN